VLALGSALLWALSWLSPPQPAALLLWGAGYQENLAVPHNVYGWQTLSDFTTVAQSSGRFTWRGSWLRLEQPPTEVRTDSPWRSWLKDVDEPAVVLYVAMHGAADERGPYLLPADTREADDAERLRIDDLLDRLAELPPEKNKLLLLDATQIDSHWRLGILKNEFARGLAALNDRIASIPGLVVISASDVNQQSWICEDQRRTVFGHFTIEALNGAARDDDRDGRIDAGELFTAVGEHVERWVRGNRAALQTPVLFPQGEEGRRRAEAIDLGSTASGYRPPESLPPLDASSSESLQQAWRRYEQLAGESPWGFHYAPTFWREYVDTLIRYEELVQAGDKVAAARLLDRLQGVEYRMLRERSQDLGSLQNSLAMRAASGLTQTQTALAMQTLNELWNASPADHADIWAKALKQAGEAPGAQELLRTALFQGLVDRMGENPADNFAVAAPIADAVADPLQPRPIEIHFALMLQRYLSPEALAEDGGQPIRAALQVRCLAEQAAVAMQPEGFAYSEEVVPWLEEVIAAGDRERRLGEDLLFAAAADRAKADEHLQSARQTYERALEMAAKLQTAIRTRNEVLERLPYYSRWLAGSVLDAYVSDPRYDAMLEQVENLWRETHHLEQQLERGELQELYRAPAPSANDPQPRSIVDRTQVVRLMYGQVVKHYQEAAEALAGGHAPSDWHAVHDALLVPPTDWRLRMKLLHAHTQALREQVGRKWQAEGGKPASRAGQAAAEAEVSVKRQRTQAMRSAQWQGRLALASLGRELFAESHQPNWETYEEVRHRLMVFEVEEQWWNSLIAVGHEIANRWRWMPQQIDELVRRAPAASDEQSLEALQLADRLARQIDGAQGAALTTKPTMFYRWRRLHDLTLNQALRTLGDRWFALDSGDEPYFRKAGLSYLADAQRLDPTSKGTQTVRERIMQAAGLTIAPLAKRDLTTERQVEIQYELTFAGSDNAPAQETTPLSYPVAWLEGDQSLEVLQPQQGDRVVRKLGPDDRAASILCTFASPVLAKNEQDPPHAAGVVGATLTLHAFLRGQQISGRVPVDLHLRAETTVHVYPRPAEAEISLIAAPELHRELGDGNGAVAFVLDCSGSMGPPSGQPADRSKYNEAVAALREVLQTIPPGVQVSVWVFGQAVGSDRTALDPATTIRRVQPPAAWDPRNRQQLDALLAKVSPPNITPWNQSPIVRTILAAKADVVDAVGFKSIVVITDGVDNCFENDVVANPQKQTIQAALTEAFRDDGVALNVIGFKVVSGQEQQARQQFEIVQSFFPPGRFYAVNQSSALAATLSTALRQRLRYWLEPTEPADGDGRDTGPRDTGPTDKTAKPQRRLFEVGNLSGGELWFDERLAPGAYRLRISSDRRVRADVTLEPGDLLPLELTRSVGGLAVSRLAYARRRFPDRPTASAADWRATVLNAQRLSDQRVQMSLAFEKTPRVDDGRLQQPRPQALWIEAATQHQPQAPGAVEWGEVEGYPTPVWSLLASSWPIDAEGNAARPTVRMWWNPDQQTPVSAVLKRTAQHTTLADLSGAVIQAADETVSVESVGVEQRYVEVAPGLRSRQPCLVVRLTYSPGKVLWARPDGIDAPGVEHRFYPSIGRYTGLFWPITAPQAEEQLREIGVVSLETLKRDAVGRGYTLELDEIPAPEPGDVRPTPSHMFH
jgi:hypothetical protein